MLASATARFRFPAVTTVHLLVLLYLLILSQAAQGDPGHLQFHISTTPNPVEEGSPLS